MVNTYSNNKNKVTNDIKNNDIDSFNSLVKAPTELKEQVIQYLYQHHISLPVPFTDNNLMHIFSINDLQAEFPNYDREDVLNKLYKTYILNNEHNYDVRVVDDKNNDMHLVTKTKIGQWSATATYIISDDSYTYHIKETGQKPSIENYIQEIKLIGKALQYNENNLSKDELTQIIVQYIMPLILIDEDKESIDFKKFVSLLSRHEYLKNLPENVQQVLYRKWALS